MGCSLLLIIVGGAFLLRNLGYLPGSAWGVIWPSLLIVLGLWSFFRQREGRSFLWWVERIGWRRRTRQQQEEGEDQS